LSDLEFQREFSPEQMREALSLLDSTAGAQNQTVQIEDLRLEEVNPKPDQSSTTIPPRDRPPTAEDPQQRRKHLNLAVAFFGIVIAAAGALALWSWRESVPPPTPRIAQEQFSKQSAALAAKSDLPVLPAAEPPPDQSFGGSERQPPTPELAGLNGAVRDAVNSDIAIPAVVPSAIDQATGTSRARGNERHIRRLRPEHTSRHTRAIRVAAAKKRIWRLHWQARAEDEWCIVACRRANGEWCFFGCRAWRAQPVFYNVTR